MVEPKDWRGVAIQLDEFRKSIEERVGWLRALVWTLLGFVGTLIALVGGVSWLIAGLPDRIKRIEDDIKEVRGDVKTSISEFQRVHEQLKSATADRHQMMAVLSRLERNRPQPAVA